MRPTDSLMLIERPRMPVQPLLFAPVYRTLKDLILSGHLLPGSKLREEELAHQLNVSRTPLREAIARLAQERLVNTIPRRGAYVVNYTKTEIMEILAIRSVLEGLVGRLAAERISDDDLAFLANLFSAQNVKKGRRNPKLLVHADQRFHERILKSTGNSRLQDLMLNLNDQMQLVRLKTIQLPGRLASSIQEHFALLDAMQRRDAKAAEKCAQQHVLNVLQAVREKYDDAQTGEVNLMDRA